MIKYIIIGYGEPRLYNMTSPIKVLCSDSNIPILWYWSDNLKKAFKFNTREDALIFIKEQRLSNCISYGVEV